MTVMDSGSASGSRTGPANINAAFDNCPQYFNADQLNSDGNFVDNSPPYSTAVDDKTWAMSDEIGDACDNDQDNDGLFKLREIPRRILHVP